MGADPLALDEHFPVAVAEAVTCPFKASRLPIEAAACEEARCVGFGVASSHRHGAWAIAMPAHACAPAAHRFAEVEIRYCFGIVSAGSRLAD